MVSGEVYFSQLPEGLTVQPVDGCQLLTVDKSEFAIVGTVNLDFFVYESAEAATASYLARRQGVSKGLRCTMSVYVCDSLAFPIILGHDFLRHFGFNVLYEQNPIELRSSTARSAGPAAPYAFDLGSANALRWEMDTVRVGDGLTLPYGETQTTSLQGRSPTGKVSRGPSIASGPGSLMPKQRAAASTQTEECRQLINRGQGPQGTTSEGRLDSSAAWETASVEKCDVACQTEVDGDSACAPHEEGQPDFGIARYIEGRPTRDEWDKLLDDFQMVLNDPVRSVYAMAAQPHVQPLTDEELARQGLKVPGKGQIRSFAPTQLPKGVVLTAPEKWPPPGLRTALTDEFLEQLPPAPAAAAVSGDDDDVPWPFPRLPASCRPACVLSTAEHWSREDIVRQQNDDPIIAEVRERRQDPQPLARTEFKIPPLRPYKKLWNVLDVADNVLVRLAHFLPEDEARWVPVVASSVRQEVMQHFHEHDGHFGRDRNLEKLRRLCYWPTMAEDVAEHVAACQQCQIAKAPGQEAPVADVNCGYGFAPEAFDEYDAAPLVEQHDTGEEVPRPPSLIEEADLPEVQPEALRSPALEPPLEVPLQPLAQEGENVAENSVLCAQVQGSDDEHSVTSVLGSPRGSTYTALDDISVVTAPEYDDAHPPSSPSLHLDSPERPVEDHDSPQSQPVHSPAPPAQAPAAVPQDEGNPPVGSVPATTVVTNDANAQQSGQVGPVGSRRSARTRHQTTFFSPDHYGQGGSYSSSATQMPPRGSE
ncbi:hypothetical protein FOZ60_013038 [Perkinsus olseni]|uniref:Integrase zinc-binding domain-containing protein n=1 Tax=Perkinsus olseni TaxID=32597 RepID=A0A7J6N9Z1_PEROL|nr:hypothetical protein FOZ60_013038 [Perkinsus olseni]